MYYYQSHKVVFAVNTAIAEKRFLFHSTYFLRKCIKCTNVRTNYPEFHQNWSKIVPSRVWLKKSTL